MRACSAPADQKPEDCILFHRRAVHRIAGRLSATRLVRSRSGILQVALSGHKALLIIPEIGAVTVTVPVGERRFGWPSAQVLSKRWRLTPSASVYPVLFRSLRAMPAPAANACKTGGHRQMLIKQTFTAVAVAAALGVSAPAWAQSVSIAIGSEPHDARPATARRRRRNAPLPTNIYENADAA